MFDCKILNRRRFVMITDSLVLKPVKLNFLSAGFEREINLFVDEMATDWNRIKQLVVLVVMCTIYTVVTMLRFAYDLLTKGTSVRNRHYKKYFKNENRFCRSC
jgi:hypothetical protein